MTLQGTMLAPIEAAAQEKGASPAIHDRNGDGTWSTTNWALLARRDDDERQLADAQSSLQDLGSGEHWLPMILPKAPMSRCATT